MAEYSSRLRRENATISPTRNFSGEGIWDPLDEPDPDAVFHATDTPWSFVSHLSLAYPKFEAMNPSALRAHMRRARRLLFKLRPDEAFTLIDQIDWSLGHFPLALSGRVREEIALLRAIGAALQDESLSALHLALRASNAQRSETRLNTGAIMVCRFAYWRLRDFDGFHSLPRPPPTGTLARRDLVPVILSRCIEASMAMEQLRPAAAKRLAFDAMEMAETRCRPCIALAAFPATIAAQALYEQGSLEDAEVLLRRHLITIDSAGVLECVWRAHAVLSRIAIHRGRPALAESLLQKAEAIGVRRGWARLVAMSISERADILLEQGRIQDAQLCAERLESLAARYPSRLSTPDADVQTYWRLTSVRIALATAATEEAVDTLHELHHAALVRKDLYAALRLAIHLAIALDLIGANEDSDKLFLRTLGLGSLTGLFQVFIDGGIGMDRLLPRAYARVQASEACARDLLPYVGSIISRRLGRVTSTSESGGTRRSGERLSGRECDILLLVGRGMSNKRIAHALTIAPETVKSHVKRIFSKLEVRTRAEAVVRAGSLGLMAHKERRIDMR
jgi:ATP/maltotriose-dependent transcriptional regulator MalT